MKNYKYNIGISCIGSGVGQSVINSLRLSKLPVRTIGLGTNPFAYGAYDCDIHDYTLNIYEEGYIQNLISKCKQYKIDLLIPGLDDEAWLFAKNAETFEKENIKIICAGEELISICRDKEKMSNELNKIADVFVKSYRKNTIEEDIKSGKILFPFIAKPRGGFASRGIEIIRNKKDLLKIKNDHILQELAVPLKDDPNYHYFINEILKNNILQVSEISIQLVYNREGNLLGRMFSYNKLNNGVPIEIVPFEDDYIWSVVDQLTPVLLKMGLKGPLNIQGRLTEKGLKIFEMNPRFTGITGLRALMGFNEVEACVKEWLGIDPGRNRLNLNQNRFGIRQTADKSLPLERNSEVKNLFYKINKPYSKKKKKLLVTGAGGYLGQNLIKTLSLQNDFEILAFDLDKEKIRNQLPGNVNHVFNTDDLEMGRLSLGNIDVLLHLGFTRPHGTPRQIAQSLEFTSELFSRAAENQVPSIINISSQSVYGSQNQPPWNETTPAAPESIYAQAKYATELFLEQAKKRTNSLFCSSLRLGTLAGGANGLVEIDLLTKFAKKSLAGDPIHIIGGMQKVQRTDIRDAVNALIKMLSSDPKIWKPIYNLSSGNIYNLIELAEKTIEISAKFNKGKKSEIIIQNQEAEINTGMDNKLFCNDFNWKPQFNIDNTIESLFTYFTLKERIRIN